jgi:hypothetical protein
MPARVPLLFTLVVIILIGAFAFLTKPTPREDLKKLEGPLGPDAC